ncbi:hypothetical protein [uncultured Alistipes sp.]|jgi:hypothetical protein|uniref:hypothetical protein n=1 Tax=uncultured Alistipes sp. TaxID=538949 RepID=UPI0025F319FC|nr:hypothetical protein [uncultured Alistipes sp.]
MKRNLLIAAILCCFAGICLAHAQTPLKPGYYTTKDTGVAQQVSFANGRLQTLAGGETSLWDAQGGNKYKRSYYYYSDPNKLTQARSGYIERVSQTSFYFYVYEDAKKLYTWQSEKGPGDNLFDTDRLDDRNRDPKSAHVDISLENVEEVAPGWEKYMTKAKEDPGNAQLWMQAAHTAMLVSSYQQDPQALRTLLLSKASLMKKMSPGIANPCPDLISQDIWNEAR